MGWSNLIPLPDSIPAPWGVFETLDIVLFALHILIVNVVVGGTLITLYSRFAGRDNDIATAVGGQVTTTFALGVTIGVAPLLFVQVLYGHLIYTSSVLMATFWILVVPALIVGYYGAYIFKYKQNQAPSLANAALLVTAVMVLYISFMFVNNMTLMMNPQEWTGYFDNRDGTMLNLGDATVYSRFVHFIVASIAVASLFSATVWRFRKNQPLSTEKERHCLRHFGWATMVQVLVGCWLLMSLPREHMLLFMGQNMLMTALFTVALLLAIVLIMFAMRGKLWATVTTLVVVVLVMAVMRAMLRTAYLAEFFSVGDLEVVPQYDVLAVFGVVLLIGAYACYYMIRQAREAHNRRVAR